MKLLLASMILALAAAGPGVAKTDGSMVCTLTGQQVEECCCIEKDGTMICTLTGEVVTSCCCTRRRSSVTCAPESHPPARVFGFTAGRTS